MKFSGKNFQAWTEFDLDLNGFVVMVGPSFSGKSSIFRALKGIIRNDIPDQRVRIDSPGLELSLTIDGETIKAVRKANGSTKYLTASGEYTSLAKGIPDALKKLNAAEVQVGDYRIDPIFASQFGEQFLLQSIGPTELNTVLGAFSSTEKLEAGKKQANLLITRKNGEAATLAEEIGDAEERREKLNKVLEFALLVDVAIKNMEPQLRLLENSVLWLGQASITKARLVPLRQLEASLAIPDTSEAERLQDTVFFLRSAALSATRITRLTIMDKHLDQAINTWNDIINLSRWAKVANETAILATKIRKVQEHGAAKGLNAVIGLMETLLSAANILQSSIKHTGQAALSTKRIADKRAELSKMETDLKALCEQNGLCAKCGKPLEHVCGS
jgi:energy-coupling factor transporter ATP-binding protein EcfA2